jgi:hypothetical protein
MTRLLKLELRQQDVQRLEQRNAHIAGYLASGQFAPLQHLLQVP